MAGIKGQRYIDENGNEVLTGGLKAAKTNMEREPDFYKRIGRIGGSVSTPTGGFASMTPERRRELGRKGGRKSSRAGIKTGEGKTSRVKK